MPLRGMKGVIEVTAATQRFAVRMLDRGEVRRLKIEAEDANGARRAALGAATDMRQCEIQEIRPVQIGFAQALAVAA